MTGLHPAVTGLYRGRPSRRSRLLAGAAALLAALGLHAAALAVFMPSAPEPVQAPAMGTGGLVLSFAGLASAEAAPMAADAVQAAAAAPASAATAAQQLAAVDSPEADRPVERDEPETADTAEPEAVAEALPEDVQEPVPEEVVEERPVEVAVAPAAALRPVEPPPPPKTVKEPEPEREIVPRPRNRPRELVRETPRERRPVPPRPEPPRPAPQVAQAQPSPQPQPATPAPQGSGATGAVASAPPQAGSPGAIGMPGGTAGQTQVPGSPDGASRNREYIAVLHAWLAKHREYPRAARMRRQEGVVMLYFAIDRDGRLLNYRIERSSGHRLLDEAVEQMIRRAAPLPPVPPDLFDGRFEVVVPIRFTIS